MYSLEDFRVFAEDGGLFLELAWLVNLAESPHQLLEVMRCNLKHGWREEGVAVLLAVLPAVQELTLRRCRRA